MSRISTFLSAHPGDQFRIVLAAMLLLLLPSIFSIGSFSRVRQRLTEFSKCGAWLVPGTPSHHRIVSAVKIADENLPGDRTCLIRSSTAEVILLIYNFDFNHRIGIVKENDGELSAHSWIKIDGKVVIGKIEELPRFTSLPPLDATEVRSK